MLPRGRPRAMGAAVLLLLLLLVVGFFLFGRDPDYGLGTTATLDEDPYRSRNLSASSPQLLLPPKCEVVVPSAAIPEVPGQSNHLGICGNHST
uniref:LARGE xylosyl- and glucuronyltransferase 2 n=1 Tax=Mus musculus TaxID=10090 RepID=H3BKM6_MOUSE